MTWQQIGYSFAGEFRFRTQLSDLVPQAGGKNMSWDVSKQAWDVETSGGFEGEDFGKTISVTWAGPKPIVN